MSCPVVTHPDPAQPSPRPKSRSRGSSPRGPADGQWRVNFEQHKRNLEHQVEQHKRNLEYHIDLDMLKQNEGEVGFREDTGNSSYRSAKALPTSQGENLAEAVTTAALREFIVMQGWMLTHSAEQKTYIETAFSEMKALQLQVLQGLQDFCVTHNTNQQTNSSPILEGTAGEARAPVAAQCIGNAQAPPTEFSSVPAPANVQPLAKDMLLDFEAGIKQGLEQFRVELAKEIEILLAQSSASPVNKGVPQQTSTPQESRELGGSRERISVSSNDFEYKKEITLIIDEEQETPILGHGLWQYIAKINFIKAQSKESQQRLLYRFVANKYFTLACIVVVVLNAIWLGYECDQEASSEHGWLKAVSLTFNTWFMVELGIRIAGLRTDFILGPDWSWNIVDALCVAVSIPDFFSTSLNVSVVRMIRLCKLSKALRLLRFVRIFRSLRVILTTVFFTLGSLFWSFVAMLFVAYIFAILLIQAVRLHADDGVQFGGQTTENFSSVYKAILALFSMITGGQEWYGIAQDLRNNGGWLAEYLLMFWIFFALFGLVNVVVAVFCAEAVEAEDSQRDLRLQKETETRTEKISELMEVFHMIDTETSGQITYEQFHEFALGAEGGIILESHGLLLIALEPLWHMMSGHQSREGVVDEAGFVMGFLRMSQEHMNTDLLLLAHLVRGLRNEVREILQNGSNDIKERRSSRIPVAI